MQRHEVLRNLGLEEGRIKVGNALGMNSRTEHEKP